MTWLLLAAAGFVAGAINGIAGGGSLVSFPALLLTGMPAVVANATNTIAVWPGSVASVFAYRGQILEQRREALVLSVPSLLGGLLGAFVLLHTSERLFTAIVPWLIVFACALLGFQGRIAAAWGELSVPRGGRVPAWLWLGQLVISIYGGYFGAGMGILMLAVLSVALPRSLQHANALKIWLGMVINALAALYFLVSGTARLTEGAVMAVASLGGGYLGAKLAQRMQPGRLRAVVVVYGLFVAIKLLLRP